MGDQRAACPNGAPHDDLAGEMELFMLVNEGGLIVKTAGDGVLVEFPTAVDAICNAVEIQHGRASKGTPSQSNSVPASTSAKLSSRSMTFVKQSSAKSPSDRGRPPDLVTGTR